MSNLSPQQIQEADELHQSSLVIDSLFLGLVGYSQSHHTRAEELVREGRAPGAAIDEIEGLKTLDLVYDPSYRQTFVDTLRRSGVKAVNHTLGAFGETFFTFGNALRDLARWTLIFDSLPQAFAKATKDEEIRVAFKTGRFAVIPGFQDTAHMENKLDNIDLFHRLGVRIVQLTYNTRNYVGDGCGERTDAGLSNFGVEFVERLNKLHMLIDLSHCGYQTGMDAAEFSKEPVAFTHVASRRLVNHMRNKLDDQLMVVAGKGGYVGVTMVPFFVGSGEETTINNYLDHVEYVIRLLGIDHVGVGTDWHGIDVPKPIRDSLNAEFLKYGFSPEHRVDWNATTKGFESWVLWPNITRGLYARGYSKDEIRKVIGGNFLSIFERVCG